jgi:hypothetical protein
LKLFFWAKAEEAETRVAAEYDVFTEGKEAKHKELVKTKLEKDQNDFHKADHTNTIQRSVIVQ